ncbi:flagellar FLiS export co-chaperone [Campylobacter sp. VicNov18]|uniref:flagellar FLiS export co-chaperone n=1 Tax=Campylobacter bilis TaxID=2691918 RepID=UPI00130E85A3|nr:flagellar FLiS export co-chaperone [Campylobacter bilis]MPV63740.1 hypothetical protein [Campylobacter hepaticus]MBM0637241.1 hypothetical protein [Campylobacter bilis]MCC8277960.1 flagellar FLiS export co-chaperone [Campylobacter bilis]MCC8299464.1 flagellar FLiS export co-chaperone [Campylobacter bilis]MCC8300869.1 flagellar FLiS export co-chaperone [Campylobacter bilis]
MNSHLDIFKKHLGEVQSMNEFQAKQMCSQIKDTNDFIGVLQVLDLSLKKLKKSILERTDQKLDDIQKRTLDATISQLIHQCSFMGTSLFDNVFNVYVGKKLFEFQIANPLLILKNSDYEGVLAYIEDKREEIKAILSQIGLAITNNEVLNSPGIYNSTKDFENLLK